MATSTSHFVTARQKVRRKQRLRRIGHFIRTVICFVLLATGLAALSRLVSAGAPQLFLKAMALEPDIAWYPQIQEGESSQGSSSVELIYQNPELPNGCEVTSLAMALCAAGYPVNHVELYQECLPRADFSCSGACCYGPSPEEYYVGDAASATHGWYCFEGPLLQAGDAWIDRMGGGSRMVQLSGLSQEELDQYAQQGQPVVVWVTMEYQTPSYSSTFSWTLPSGELYVPYNNLHCVLLTGEEQNCYKIADPLYGWQEVDKDLFWNSFDAMGRRAVTVIQL